MGAAVDETEDWATRSGERVRVAVPDQVEGGRARAKHLPLHLSNVGPLVVSATVESAPRRLSSVVRSRGRVGAAALFVELMNIAGVSSAEVAAAIDVVPQRVAQMRSGERAVELGDVLLMAERLDAVRAVFVRMAAEMLGREADGSP